MKSKSFVLMILSLGFGLVAAIGISQLMKNNSANANPVEQMGPVLVAAQHLNVKTELTEENVRIENWPLRIIPEDAARTIEDIVDQAIVSPLSPGMPIVKSQIAHKNKVGTTNIPTGFKVYSLKASAESTNGGLLSPGHKVDVIGLFKRRNKAGRDQTISKTFLKAIRVFAINGNMNAVLDDEEKKSSGSATVSLLVTEKQAEEIAFVQKIGDVKLNMRGEAEDGDTETESLADIMRLEEEADLSDQPNSAVAVDAPAIQPPPKQQGMVVFIGNEARKVMFVDGMPQQVGMSPEEQQFISAPRPASPAVEDSDEGDFDGRMENNRGIEEDQYRSE
jgi:pilus assembly protein CpaB